MFSQLFAGPNQVWLEVALLAALVAVLLFKPERIERPRYFWRGCLLFVLSIFTPAVLAPFDRGIDPEAMIRGGSAGVWPVILAIVPATFFALSVLSTLYALFPASDEVRCWPFAGEKPETRRTARRR